MKSQVGLHCGTNSLSLRERARVRGTAAGNSQGLGALPGVELCFPSLRVVDLIGSSQARWFVGRFFPLTPALSPRRGDRKSTRLNSSHITTSYAVFCLKKKKITIGWIVTDYKKTHHTE